MLLSFFNAALKIFADAAKHNFPIDHYYAVANNPVQLRFATTGLARVLSPALDHLAAECVPSPSLTVCLWDSASTKKHIPPFPWERNAPMGSGIQTSKEGTNPAIYFKDDRIRGAYQIGTKTLSMLDTKSNTAIFFVPDFGKIPYYDMAKPLRAIVQWWAAQFGLQLLHAGAVGNSKAGILLVGGSGSGKSTTALACLDSELSYVSDDFCLVSMDSDPYAHSVYCSAAIDRGTVQRFPHLVSAIEHDEGLCEEKVILFLNKHWPKKISLGFSVRSLLVPRITNAEKTSLTPASPRSAFMALAPSTIVQLRGAGQEDLTLMAELTRRIPSFFLELGQDVGNIPDIIFDVLSKT